MSTETKEDRIERHYFFNREIGTIAQTDPSNISFGVDVKSSRVIPVSLLEAHANPDCVHYEDSLDGLKEQFNVLGLDWEAFWTSVNTPVPSTGLHTTEQINALRLAGRVETPAMRWQHTFVLPPSIRETCTLDSIKRQIAAVLTERHHGSMSDRIIENLRDRKNFSHIRPETVATLLEDELIKIGEFINTEFISSVAYKVTATGTVTINLIDIRRL